MPIKIPDHLPARAILEREGIVVIGQNVALHQDIRPLKIALLNLMPNKIPTETQFARLCGATPLQVELTLLKMSDHVPKNTEPSHLSAFYRCISEVESESFDGLIVTGAPVEHLPFEEVRYWPQLCRFFDWAEEHVHALLCVCWGGQAALSHHHRVPKHTLSQKVFGVYDHHVTQPFSPYLRGFCDRVPIPISRWSETRTHDLPQGGGVRILLDSEQTGPCLLEDPSRRTLYMLNHWEYDTTTLKEEYLRDLSANKNPALPVGYFPDQNPAQPPGNTWRAHAHLFFANWLHEIYQTTPFDLRDLCAARPHKT